MNCICLDLTQYPISHLIGHVKRKHGDVQGNGEPARHAKRKCNAMADDDVIIMDQPRQKRARTNANSNHVQEHSSSPLRPITPPMQSPSSSPANENATNNTATQQPFALSTVQLENDTYNVVHISDCELNKLMEGGRVRISNGQMFLKDSVEEEENE